MAVLGHKIISNLPNTLLARANKRLATSANTKLEDVRMRTERESGKLEWQTSANLAYSA